MTASGHSKKRSFCWLSKQLPTRPAAELLFYPLANASNYDIISLGEIVQNLMDEVILLHI